MEYICGIELLYHDDLRRVQRNLNEFPHPSHDAARSCPGSLGRLVRWASGSSRDEILADFPYLEADDIVAALEFAAAQADHPVLRIA